MFESGEIMDGKYRVEGMCSQSGGMGEILFVTALSNPPAFRLVLKYCRGSDDEQLRRFRREVRLLGEFSGNSKVVQIWDHNLEADPPYLHESLRLIRQFAAGFSARTLHEPAWLITLLPNKPRLGRVRSECYRLAPRTCYPLIKIEGANGQSDHVQHS